MCSVFAIFKTQTNTRFSECINVYDIYFSVSSPKNSFFYYFCAVFFSIYTLTLLRILSGKTSVQNTAT